MRDKVLIVAEMSANHGQSLQIALETIEAAKDAGADAIKIQTYTPDTITLDSDKEWFQIRQGTIWDGRTLYDLYKEAYTPWEWHQELKACAESYGLLFFSTPFDPTAVDFLISLGVPMLKIASFEITDIPLIRYSASKGLPLLISTGVASLGDIAEVMRVCYEVGNHDVTLLKCTSSYPAKPEHMNLKTITNMRDTFDVDVGLSDHTMGSSVAVAAVALGACVVEKHFILRRSIGGPDASFSMEPTEFRDMVRDIRIVESALGKISYKIMPENIRNLEFRRSLFAVRDIAEGESFTMENVRSIRPGYGMHPRYLDNLLTRTARRAISRGTPLSWSDIC
ncbi:MAG: pseudaminic acid synthase [Candidatus Zixiibacteriota bacterium]